MSDNKTGKQATDHTYRGRFAPSPTGPLHFGSLIAAVASYLEAAAAGGEWLVRIEDIDPTREQPGAATAILRSLEAHGFEFDSPLFQSTRLAEYDEIIAKLSAKDAAYSCSCSRKELRATATHGVTGPIYPGTCRLGAATESRPAISVRARTNNKLVEFTDGLQGTLSCCPETEIGDFLVRRGDGLVAYQLAVVVDDHHQNISHIVRGTDLLEPTFMQLCLQRLLRFPEPRYMHFPIATAADGSKLSKQTGAPPLDDSRASENLLAALQFLQQDLSNIDKSLKSNDILKIASKGWDAGMLKGVRRLRIGV